MRYDRFLPDLSDEPTNHARIGLRPKVIDSIDPNLALPDPVA